MAIKDDQTIRDHWRCFLACGLIILSPFQYGIDFGLIGGLQAMPGFLKVYGHEASDSVIGWNLSPVRQQLITSLMSLGAFMSSGTAGFVAIKLGRKTCLYLAIVGCYISNIIMMTTTDINALYVGRLLNGLANGYFMVFAQLWLQESSPAKYRGLFLSVFQFSTSFGRVEEGRKALHWLRPDIAKVEVELEEIKDAIARECEMGSSVGVVDMFKNPIDRRRTFLSIFGVTTQAASGSMFVISYKAYFFTMARVPNPFAMSCVFSTVGLLALVANSLIIVRYGRRRVLLMSGLITCGILQLIIAVIYDQNPGTTQTGKVIIGLSTIYISSYNAMIAPYAWLSGGEIPSQRLRSYTFGAASAVAFLAAWLVAFTAPYFINVESLNWGPRYGYIWFPSCMVTAIWVYFFLPEVQGRTLEEIDEMFEAKLGARKFRGYQCVRRIEVEEKPDVKHEEL
ncbi:hypothetical protein DL766_005981 [Monosporascus sp. MC13-8B]|nr:hypothetical protein DL763_003972 [Monosporascus cannonballus]RYP28236.1 hypothetical protein DL766_005981 [Monosporascus sp. MC13-8B]